ncbi:MAG: RNA-guided pseudouridylation complex pseudouridine synthase subunit Cbf5 [ANME-2 cluster archaeon]|nr:RNA-guided pseudouridylation complex pseudouridine synthase subunit Cbf5 [ANME-2 cluster archaeon]
MKRTLPADIERELKEKVDDTTDPTYGFLPNKRPILEHIKNGVINLDKPSGPTSHEVVSWIKKILDLPRAGHGGTLDPKVTGLLPVMLGDATKSVGALMSAGKEYICLMKLHSTVKKTALNRVVQEFTGPIYQRPPVKSAVKREVRIRNIYYLDILEMEGTSVLMRVGCESGTYIRKLCHDMGAALGTGAHMQELRRTRSGPFQEDDSKITLFDLKDAMVIYQESGDESELRRVILPMEAGLVHLPRIVIRDSTVDAICHGASLAAPGVVKVDTGMNPGDRALVMSLKGEAVALADTLMDSDAMLEADTGLVANTKRVLMPEGMYPKGWTAKTKKR